MQEEISQNCLKILKCVKQPNLEQEARLGRFYKDKFLPGVNKRYFESCKKLLMKFPTRAKHTYSICFYFSNGLRAERFESKTETIRKYKVADDIDIKMPNRYALRVSTSVEEPVNEAGLMHEVSRYTKTQKLPKLFRGGNLFKFREGTIVYYHNRPCKTDKFNDLSWKSSYPCSLTTTNRIKVNFKSPDRLTPETYVKVSCIAGEMKGVPVPIGYYTVKVKIGDLVPLCCYSDVNMRPPFIATSWRKKERISFTLWEGMTIDLTKTTFTKMSLQHCFDGRGITHYEMEADWDTIHKSTNDFAEAVCKILFTL